MYVSELDFKSIMSKYVKGNDVVWANNGRVYIPRDLHDRLPEHMQGISFECKTRREFENFCSQMETFSEIDNVLSM